MHKNKIISTHIIPHEPRKTIKIRIKDPSRLIFTYNKKFPSYFNKNNNNPQEA